MGGNAYIVLVIMFRVCYDGCTWEIIIETTDPEIEEALPKEILEDVVLVAIEGR